jgi:hypothetical protein
MAVAIQDSETPRTPRDLSNADADAVDEAAAMTTTTEKTPDGHGPVSSRVPVVVLNKVLSTPMDFDAMGVRKRTRANMGDEDSPPTPFGSPDKAVLKKPALGSTVGSGPRSRKGSK